MLTAMIVRFTKMQGAGNDFIVIDSAEGFDPDRLGRDGRRRLADRRLGIGCDQLLVLGPPRHENTDAWIRIFNSDGHEAAQCGNGMRCLALYLNRRDPARAAWHLEGVAGLVAAQVHDDNSVTVDMGAATLSADAVGCLQPPPVVVDGAQVDFVPVSMGNPHAVIFVDDVTAAPVGKWGPALQPFFADGVNAGFAEVTGDSTLALRVWERGSGETLACGTGACAAAVAAISRGMAPGEIAVDLPGGQLMVKCAHHGGSISLRGPAQQVFEGQIAL